MVEKSPFSNSSLDQFVSSAKTAKGAACVELIKQVLEAPGVYVFGELLDMPNVIELNNAEDKKCINTLNLFAYGTYKEYLSNPSNYLSLTAGQKKKLQHLTIVTLATQSKSIPYHELLQELDIENVRELEDLIIEAVYAGIIQGKLDQNNHELDIQSAIGRDVREKDINVIINCLQEWCSACEGVLNCVDAQIHRANSEKNVSIERKAFIESEINSIKKMLKVQMQECIKGSDEVMATDSREATATGEKGKKSFKGKGIRSTSKFWLK